MLNPISDQNPSNSLGPEYNLDLNHWIKEYQTVRNKTLNICSNLEIEDYAVQISTEVSPPKWHLGHTTWFFDEMILKSQGLASEVHPVYNLIFNSYYNSAGKHWKQDLRGHLSRPTTNEIVHYRSEVDDKILNFIQSTTLTPELSFLMMAGVQHEKQHQELLYMDIKAILGANPLFPPYALETYSKAYLEEAHNISFDEGIYEVGYQGEEFHYDNEGPKHKTYLTEFNICNRLVTNQEYLEFIESGGYSQPLLWLSDGWDWVENNQICAPKYWYKDDLGWSEFTLYGLSKIDKDAPVTHISYYEADAYACWRNKRLPTEFESEIFLQTKAETKKIHSESIHPQSPNSPIYQNWWWTSSHYSPYPGYVRFKGSLEEYNGKFMCNQFVLKGGCVVTPDNHYRHTYRNFYRPDQRWMFSGIRLAEKS